MDTYHKLNKIKGIITELFCNNQKFPIISSEYLGRLFNFMIPINSVFPNLCHNSYSLRPSSIFPTYLQSAISQILLFLLGFSQGNELAHSHHGQITGCQEDTPIPLTFLPVPQGHLLSFSASSPLEKSSFVLVIANEYSSHGLPEDVLACPVIPQKGLGAF